MNNMAVVGEILACVGEILQERPYLRFSQLVENAALKAGWKSSDIFYCENETILKGLRAMLEEMK